MMAVFCGGDGCILWWLYSVVMAVFCDGFILWWWLYSVVVAVYSVMAVFCDNGRIVILAVL